MLNVEATSTRVIPYRYFVEEKENTKVTVAGGYATDIQKFIQ